MDDAPLAVRYASGLLCSAGVACVYVEVAATASGPTEALLDTLLDMRASSSWLLSPCPGFSLVQETPLYTVIPCSAAEHTCTGADRLGK